jgi:hypothetical protein
MNGGHGQQTRYGSAAELQQQQEVQERDWICKVLNPYDF